MNSPVVKEKILEDSRIASAQGIDQSQYHLPFSEESPVLAHLLRLCYPGDTTSHATNAQNHCIAAHAHHKKMLAPSEELIAQMDDQHAFGSPTAERMGIGLPSCMYSLLAVHDANESVRRELLSFAVLSATSMPLSSPKSPTPSSPGYTHRLLDG